MNRRVRLEGAFWGRDLGWIETDFDEYITN
jgi:hypothetical protein